MFSGHSSLYRGQCGLGGQVISEELVVGEEGVILQVGEVFMVVVVVVVDRQFTHLRLACPDGRL